MATTSERMRFKPVDYKQLNSRSSVVLYNTLPKKRKEKYYSVERIIERRKRSRGYCEYLIKWKGWPFHSCSWEPSDHLTPALLRSYEQPLKPNQERLERACRDFTHAVSSSLKSKSFAAVYASMELDVWRYVMFGKGIPSQHKGHMLYEKEDFCRLPGLLDNWYYSMNQHGEGIKVDFPIKVKPVLTWANSNFVAKNNKLQVAPKIPLEKISISFAKAACSINNI